MKKPIILILSVLVVCSVMYLTFKKDFDQFNPLYKEEYAFSVVNTPGKAEVSNRGGTRYRYNLTGFTEQGRKKEFTFSSSKQLDQGIYVKALAKGAYTREWVLIHKEEVPSLALDAIASK